MRANDTRLQRSAGALALVLTFVLAQFAGALHLALERHEVCADHGELIHVADAHRVADAHGPAPADPVDHVSVEGAGEVGEHAHCDVLPATERRREVARAPGELALAPPIVVERALNASSRPHEAIPLLLRAPALSPPV